MFNIIFLTFYESSAKQPVRFLLDFKVFQFIFMPTLQSVTHKHFNKALVCFFIFPVCAVHDCVHGNLTFLVVCIKQKQKTNTSVYHVRWGHQLGKLPWCGCLLKTNILFNPMFQIITLTGELESTKLCNSPVLSRQRYRAVVTPELFPSVICKWTRVKWGGDERSTTPPG